jgi:outer membrane protein assembly factor BamE (lipoprotein component of BamABCDE complex)
MDCTGQFTGIGGMARQGSGVINRTACGAFIASVTLLLASCQQAIQVHGNLPEPDDLAILQPGVHSRGDVIELLGTPSTMSTFGDKTWYYIGSKQEQFAFLDPEVLEQSVFAVSFDDTGIVQETRLYTQVDGRMIEPIERETPTEGQELTILQQLFGNFGRFPTEELQDNSQ